VRRAYWIEIARDLPGRARKIALLCMAQAWMALADEAGKKTSGVVPYLPRSEEF